MLDCIFTADRSVGHQEMDDSQQWTWTDGWILMAVFVAAKDRGAGLHMIIAAADATNHAIPTTREMSQALSKFLQCGLIRQEEGKFSIGSDYLPAIEKAYKGRSGLFATGDKGLKWLRNSSLVAHSQESAKLTDAEMKTAYDQYMRVIRRDSH